MHLTAKGSPCSFAVKSPLMAAQKFCSAELQWLSELGRMSLFPTPKHAVGEPIGTGFMYSAVAVREMGKELNPRTFVKNEGASDVRVTSSLLSETARQLSVLAPSPGSKPLAVAPAMASASTRLGKAGRCTTPANAAASAARWSRWAFR